VLERDEQDRVLKIVQYLRGAILSLPPTHLQHSLRQPRLLRKLLQVFGVRIVIDGEVRLHRPKLMVFERRTHALRPLLSV
jgi:hypothetical protein